MVNIVETSDAVECNGIWCDSINYACQVDGFEDKKYVNATSRSSSLCMDWCATNTVGCVSHEKFNANNLCQITEQSIQLPISSVEIMTSHECPAPDQNAPSCTYRYCLFRVSW